MTAVAATASARARHSRRIANHSSPRPGVTLVSSGNAHVPDQRNPSTIAAASSRWMLPIITSWLTGSASTSSEAGQGRASHHATAASRIVQPTMNTSRGRSPMTANTCANAGE